ncbi:alpha/beta fold hydrolase [Streptomyces cellostaticus]|uniref:alpha/beta fold hydrolase n=1 Tax=Streptomyces cellostaticus TaxID=67285 RepID=UPI0024467516|nr:alpha/beta hydrolase [Streptomyces cellostaticus]
MVHGLWADGSCWTETTTELRALGHEPVAAQPPLESLEDDVAAVRRGISTVEGPVLLVGWSYGGFVITNAARGQDRVRALAYVAAFVPDAGETVADIAHRHPGRSCLSLGCRRCPSPIKDTSSQSRHESDGSLGNRVST